MPATRNKDEPTERSTCDVIARYANDETHVYAHTRAQLIRRNLLPRQRRAEMPADILVTLGPRGVGFYRARGFTSRPQQPGVSPIAHGFAASNY